jgi:hypothetical protein
MADNPEMIERVARAIWSADRNVGGYGWEWLDESWRAGYYAQARSAIEAMREPTEEMIERGDDHAKGWFASISVTYDSEEVWHAMIDAALGKH